MATFAVSTRAVRLSAANSVVARGASTSKVVLSNARNHKRAAPRRAALMVKSESAVAVAEPVEAAPAAPAKRSLAMLMRAVEDAEMKSDLMEFRVGHEVKCNVTVTEGNKTRVQPFQGTIISMHKAGNRSTITVRKVVQNIGVERVFPLHSPLVSFEAVPGSGTPKVRRAKLYYLRKLRGKQARLKRKF